VLAACHVVDRAGRLLPARSPERRPWTPVHSASAAARAQRFQASAERFFSASERYAIQRREDERAADLRRLREKAEEEVVRLREQERRLLNCR